MKSLYSHLEFQFENNPRRARYLQHIIRFIHFRMPNTPVHDAAAVSDAEMIPAILAAIILFPGNKTGKEASSRKMSFFAVL